jgi:iron(III) transport system substrate-binding protein
VNRPDTPSPAVLRAGPRLRRTLLRFLAAGGLAGPAVLAAACGGAGVADGTGTTGTGGKDAETGTLNVMASPQQDWIDAQVKAFRTKTGIDTAATRLSGGEGLAKLRAEDGAPSFDVWWGSPSDSFISAKKLGLLTPYKSPTAAEIPDKYKDKDGFWNGIYVGSIGFAINTRRAQEKNIPEPRTWDDLLKPVYKGEVVMAHPATSGTALTSMMTVLQLRKRDETEFWKWARAFHNNVLQYTKSGAGPMAILERAEATVGVVFSHDIFVSVEKGLPIKLTFPTDGTGYEVGAMALIKGAKNTASAKKWIDWALTVEGQEIGVTAKAYQAPSNPKAKVPKPEFLQVKLIDYDAEYAGTMEEQLRTRFTEDIAPQPKS